MKLFLQMYFIFLLGLFLQIKEVSAQSKAWVIKKTEWSQFDEKNWQSFVQAIGEKVEKRECFKVSDCFRSVANPYRSSDPEGLAMYSDCADFPYVMRAYFAWKNSLPFSFVSLVKPKPLSGNTQGDIRYNSFGNIPVTRFDLINSTGSINAITAILQTIPNSISSAMFRVNEAESYSNILSDFYPAELSREGIRPGTALYDPNGHVALVYKVTADGRVFYIDAHPDNSLTSGLYNAKFVRSNPGQGSGFKNFRPLKLVGANLNSQGTFAGGQIVFKTDAEISKASMEQYYGNKPSADKNWKKGEFIFKGQKLNYYDYVRNALSLGELKVNPVEDLKTLIADTCVALKDRVLAVDSAVSKGISAKPHPSRLPFNIYGTDGEWETYSTPSRDARLKVSFVEILLNVKSNYEKYLAQDPSIQYNGHNLKEELIAAYNKYSSQCRIQYTNSLGKTIELDLEEVRKRLFSLSFDPYHCVELRWGAQQAPELSSCVDDQNKRKWFAAEKWLRNQLDRRYDVRMDFSLEELIGPKPGAGVDLPPQTDMIQFLNQY